jgi:hypothetical protein
MEEFKRSQAPVRKQSIDKYIADNQLTAQVRKALIDLMTSGNELAPLYIRL